MRKQSRSFLRLLPRLGFLAGIAVAWIILRGGAYAQGEDVARTRIPMGSYRIAGTVVNAKTGGLLARSRVTIADAKHRQSMQSVVTGDDGRFEFHVPAGKYSLEGEKRGFIAASYDQHEQFSTAIVTGGEFDSEHLTLRLAPNAVLRGQVLDEFGEPVRQAQVTVYRESHQQGVSRVSRFRVAATDDQGRYEITPLDAGTYFVSAKASPWYSVRPSSNGEGEPSQSSASQSSQIDPALDVVYPTTFYGDASEAEDAAAIPMRGGDRLEADIHLAPAPSLHLTVHVPENNQGVNLPMLQKPVFDGWEPVANPDIQNVAPGVYEISGIAAGRYMVRTPDASGQMKEPTEVNLNGGGELDITAGSATSSIKATVQMEGGGPLPAQMQLGLRNAKRRMIGTRIDEKGTANFSDVVAGKYDVVANSQTQAYSVTRIESEAGAVAGHEVNVPAGASLTLTFTLVGSTVSVEGFAKRGGKGAGGAMVVLVPKNPEANLDRFRRDQSDLDGSFVLKNVIPGTYTIVAIEDGWELDWARAAALSPYLERGQTIEVGDRAAAAVHLTDAVEIQNK
jgi:Carboxypeptidase regulatory-like domain